MNDLSLAKRLNTHFANELASALVGDPLNPPAVEAALGAASGQGVLIAAKVTGAQTGTIAAWVALSAAEDAARSAKGTETPSVEEILGVIRDVASQAAAGIALLPDGAGLHVSITAVTPGSPPSQASRFTFSMPSGSQATVAVTANLALAVQPQGRSNNLELVLDVELPLVVRFGRTVMSLKALSGLGPGSIVDMGRSPDDPVELLVSEKVVAYGEVVIVDGSYGLRITELVSRPDQARAGESR